MSDEQKAVQEFWTRFGPVGGDPGEQQLFNTFLSGYRAGVREGTRRERAAIIWQVKQMGRERDKASDDTQE